MTAAVLLASQMAMAASVSRLPAASGQPHASIGPGTRFYIDPDTQVMRWTRQTPATRASL